MAINKVEANGETLIDLTNDTVTANDVLEGKTLHLASGAIATGTYRPSDEIEARLEATVGHSSKNLFDRQFRQGTIANITTASAVCSTTIIKTTNGATHRFKCFDNNFVLRVYGLNEAGAQQILSGTGVTAANRLFDSNYIFSGTYERTNDNSNIVAYAIMFRKTSRQGQEDWINITPSDVPNDILMVVESPLTIDTFEPYVTPTDEKKQDKPVVLWEATTKTEMIEQVTFPTTEIENIGYFIVFVEVRSELPTTSDVVTFIVYNGMFFNELNYYYNISTMLTFGIEEGIAGITVVTTDTDTHEPKIIKIVGIPK